MPIIPFEKKLEKESLEVTRTPLEVIQVNVGKLCNQACHHCHVEASPKRTEIMERKTVDRLLELISKSQAHTVDITGGAPEMNPHFKDFVAQIRQMDKDVIDRCNLTIFYEKGYEEIPEFLRDHQIQVVASLPCYSMENVDKQRGKGVFDQSIRALQKLNELGYGKNDEKLKLSLVYNPVGNHLPPDQQKLEADFKRELKKHFGIEFDHLYTITNMPIKRYLEQLKRFDQLEDYMQLLLDNFNAKAALEVMCRNQLSVSWDGKLYDCDFNQMLEIPISGKPTTIWEVEDLDALNGPIAFDDHCFGCTAGSGSSCGGALLS